MEKTEAFIMVVRNRSERMFNILPQGRRRRRRKNLMIITRKYKINVIINPRI